MKLALVLLFLIALIRGTSSQNHTDVYHYEDTEDSYDDYYYYDDEDYDDSAANETLYHAETALDYYMELGSNFTMTCRVPALAINKMGVRVDSARFEITTAQLDLHVFWDVDRNASRFGPGRVWTALRSGLEPGSRVHAMWSEHRDSIVDRFVVDTSRLYEEGVLTLHWSDVRVMDDLLLIEYLFEDRTNQISFTSTAHFNVYALPKVTLSSLPVKRRNGEKRMRYYCLAESAYPFPRNVIFVPKGTGGINSTEAVSGMRLRSEYVRRNPETLGFDLSVWTDVSYSTSSSSEHQWECYVLMKLPESDGPESPPGRWWIRSHNDQTLVRPHETSYVELIRADQVRKGSDLVEFECLVGGFPLSSARIYRAQDNRTLPLTEPIRFDGFEFQVRTRARVNESAGFRCEGNGVSSALKLVRLTAGGADASTLRIRVDSTTDDVTDGHVSVCEGDRLALTCELAAGGTDQLYWSRDHGGTPIDLNLPVPGALTREMTEFKDASVYTCHGPGAISRSVNVTVVDPCQPTLNATIGTDGEGNRFLRVECRTKHWGIPHCMLKLLPTGGTRWYSTPQFDIRGFSYTYVFYDARDVNSLKEFKCISTNFKTRRESRVTAATVGDGQREATTTQETKTSTPATPGAEDATDDTDFTALVIFSVLGAGAAVVMICFMCRRRRTAIDGPSYRYRRGNDPSLIEDDELNQENTVVYDRA